MINTRQIEVPVITKTVTQYQCPLCRKWHESEQMALECLRRGIPQHKYAVGDVLLVGHHPGDYYEEEYLIIEKLLYKNRYDNMPNEEPKGHDDEPVYGCAGDTIRECQVVEFVMTNDEREKKRLKAGKVSRASGIRWSSRFGVYEVTTSF